MIPHLPRRQIPRAVPVMFAALALSVLLLAVQFSLRPAAATAETDEITVQRVGIKIEYPVTDGPVNVAWESPGRSWFTSPSKDTIGVITRDLSADGELFSVSIEYLPQEYGSSPHGIAIANGTVWFTLLGSNQIGRIDLNGAAAAIPAPKYYTMPVADSRPSALAIAADGIVWIVSASRPNLVRFDPATETFTSFSYSALMPAGRTVSTDRTVPDVAVNGSDIVYFTVPGADRVLAYRVADDDFSNLPTRQVLREPSAISVDDSGTSSGNVCGGPCPWVTLFGANLVGRFSPNTASGWDWLAIPTPDSGPRGIAIKNNGATWDVWITEETAGKIGRLTITPAPSYSFLSYAEMALPDGSLPRDIVAGDDDTVWFTESGRRTVSEIRPPYIKLTRLPLIFGGQ